jgi:hypothetical protein
MTLLNYDVMNIDELRSYVLSHREDIDAFEVYVDQSKATGRMISISPEDSSWEDVLAQKMSTPHYSQEQNL